MEIIKENKKHRNPSLKPLLLSTIFYPKLPVFYPFSVFILFIGKKPIALMPLAF